SNTLCDHHNDTTHHEVYTLSLHDALPIYLGMHTFQESSGTSEQDRVSGNLPVIDNLSARETHVFLLIGSGRDTKKIAHSLRLRRSEEHTSELQSRVELVCRLLLEKKKQTA